MLLIKNGKILTMAGLTYDKGSILINGKKIVGISDKISTNEKDILQVIDATNCWVLPGLIESHCHVGIIEERKGFEGDDCNEKNEPLTPYLKALDAINPMDSSFHNALSAGITGLMVGPGSSNIVGGQFVFIKAYGRSIDKMVLLEPAAMKIAFGENPKSNYDSMSKMPTTRMAIGAMLREELFEAKKYHTKKQKAKKSGDNFEEDFRKECWIPVLEKKIPLKAHVHRADDILTAIRDRKSTRLNSSHL